MSKMRTKSNIVLITGASRGIGAAIALRLARDGFDIWLNYRSNREAAEKVRESIVKTGRRCELIPFNVSDPEDVNNALKQPLSETVPDVLVNNAGITRDTLLVWMKEEEWDTVIRTHLNGFFNVTKLIVFGMMKQRSGRVINITSTSGESGLAGQTNYSAAKAGIIGATKALAREVAGKGILVNAVSPGIIETDMTEKLPMEELKKGIPLKRPGKPEDVAGAVSFLCSEDAGYITGQVLSVNGGLYM